LQIPLAILFTKTVCSVSIVTALSRCLPGHSVAQVRILATTPVPRDFDGRDATREIRIGIGNRHVFLASSGTMLPARGPPAVMHRTIDSAVFMGADSGRVLGE